MIASDTAGRGTPRGLVLDEGRREVRLDGVVVDVTASEFALLAALIAQPGVAVNSRDLLSAMWGIEWSLGVSSLYVHISRLRSKLGESGNNPRYIHAVRGFGYRFEPDAAALSVVLEFDADFRLRALTPNAPLLGWQPAEIIGGFYSPVGLDEPTSRSLVAHLIQVGQAQMQGPVQVVHRDGSARTAHIDNRIEVDETGYFAGLRTTLFLESSFPMGKPHPD